MQAKTSGSAGSLQECVSLPWLEVRAPHCSLQPRDLCLRAAPSSLWGREQNGPDSSWDISVLQPELLSPASREPEPTQPALTLGFQGGSQGQGGLWPGLGTAAHCRLRAGGHPGEHDTHPRGGFVGTRRAELWMGVSQNAMCSDIFPKDTSRRTRSHTCGRAVDGPGPPPAPTARLLRSGAQPSGERVSLASYCGGRVASGTP